MDFEPGQPCKRCGTVINGAYTVCYNKSGDVEQVICGNCSDNEGMDEYKNSKYISTKVMVQAALAKFYLENDTNGLRHETQVLYLKNKKALLEIAEITKQLEKLTGEFEDKHWIPYLCKYWNDAQSRGHIAEIDDYKIMMWGSAGRVILTVENKIGSVSMIFSDSAQTEESVEKWGRMRGGVQGISSTGSNAIQLLNNLVKTEKISFKPKDSVTVLGL